MTGFFRQLINRLNHLDPVPCFECAEDHCVLCRPECRERLLDSSEREDARAGG